MSSHASDEDDIIPTTRRPANGPNGTNDNDNSDDDADLFGSDGDDAKPRLLDDEDLDSGDDQDRQDRANGDEDHEMEDLMEEKPITTMTVDVGRQPVPVSSDGEVSFLFANSTSSF